MGLWWYPPGACLYRTTARAIHIRPPIGDLRVASHMGLRCGLPHITVPGWPTTVDWTEIAETKLGDVDLLFVGIKFIPTPQCALTMRPQLHI